MHLNGGRVKPAKLIQAGDTLEIRRGRVEFTVTVLGLADRRGPARVARTLYEETEESRYRREQAREQHRILAAAAPRPDRRPDKRDRRRIRAFIRKG